MTAANARRLLIWHPIIDPILRVLHLRDRLRCPHCGSVGTWKPHGGILDRADTKRIPRWLCKWCGLYVGRDGTFPVDTALISGGRWMLYREHEATNGGPVYNTPRGACRIYFGIPIHPWDG